MIGLSTSGSISFGCALVAGRNRVPRPAAGNTALRTMSFIAADRSRTRKPGIYNGGRGSMLDPAYVRDNIEVVRAGLRSRGLDPDKALEEIATFETIRRRLI